MEIVWCIFQELEIFTHTEMSMETSECYSFKCWKLSHLNIIQAIYFLYAAFLCTGGGIFWTFCALLERNKDGEEADMKKKINKTGERLWWAQNEYYGEGSNYSLLNIWFLWVVKIIHRHPRERPQRKEWRKIVFLLACIKRNNM